MVTLAETERDNWFGSLQTFLIGQHRTEATVPIPAPFGPKKPINSPSLISMAKLSQSPHVSVSLG